MALHLLGKKGRAVPTFSQGKTRLEPSTAAPWMGYTPSTPLPWVACIVVGSGVDLHRFIGHLDFCMVS